MSTQGKQSINSEDMAIINVERTADSLQNGFQIIHSQKLLDLKKHKRYFRTLNYKDPILYWTQGKGSIGVLVVLISFGFIISCIQANRKISKYFKKKFEI